MTCFLYVDAHGDKHQSNELVVVYTAEIKGVTDRQLFDTSRSCVISSLEGHKLLDLLNTLRLWSLVDV